MAISKKKLKSKKFQGGGGLNNYSFNTNNSLQNTWDLNGWNPNEVRPEIYGTYNAATGNNPYSANISVDMNDFDNIHKYDYKGNTGNVNTEEGGKTGSVMDKI